MNYKITTLLILVVVLGSAQFIIAAPKETPTGHKPVEIEKIYDGTRDVTVTGATTDLGSYMVTTDGAPSGASSDKYNTKLGTYNSTDHIIRKFPVFQKDKDYLFVNPSSGFWTIGENPFMDIGYFRHPSQATDTPPSTGWQYRRKDSYVWQPNAGITVKAIKVHNDYAETSEHQFSNWNRPSKKAAPKETLTRHKPVEIEKVYNGTRDVTVTGATADFVWNSGEECSEPCSSPKCEGLSKLMSFYLDLSVDPCDDFFAFSCNTKTRGTKAPISPKNGISIEQLVKSPPKGFEYIKKFFLSCTKVNTTFSTEEVFANCFEDGKCEKEELKKDYGDIFAQFLDYTHEFINRTKFPAVTPNWEQATQNLYGGLEWNWWDFAATGLKDYYFLAAFQNIEKIKENDEYVRYDTFRSNVFFAPMIDTVLPPGDDDDYYPTIHIIPMSIPDNLRTGNETYWRKYKNIMKQILIFFEADPLTVDNDVKNILDMELQVGKINPKKWFSTMDAFEETVTIEELYILVPYVEWKDYIEEAFSHNTNFQIRRGQKIKIPSKSLMRKMGNLIESLSTRNQANLLIWRMFIQFANDFMHTGSHEGDIQQSHFNKIASDSTRSSKCISQIKTFFPKAYNDMYIGHYLDESTKTNIKTLFEKLRKGFEQVINENDWMSNSTKILAREKLAATKINVGELSPNTAEFQELKMKMSTSDYIGNVLAIGNYIWDTLSKNIEEEMKLYRGDARENNANYVPLYNDIEIFTGLINHQFVHEALSPGLPRALLFGGFVSTSLGHELVHGFDDNGKQFDKHGYRRNWWLKKDDDNYSKKTECMRYQYDNFSITYNGYIYQNPGENPQGENIADNGGVKAAYRSYLKLPVEEKKCMPDLPFTSDQLFWLGHSLAWCAESSDYSEKDYDELLLSGIDEDGHYPPPWRVNTVLANQPQFAADFNCPVGSPMNPQPEDRCIIW